MKINEKKKKDKSDSLYHSSHFLYIFSLKSMKLGKIPKSQILNPLFQGSAHYDPWAVSAVLLEQGHAH